MTVQRLRTLVYVDGFNLYFGCLKRAPRYRWLDVALFTGRPTPGNPGFGGGLFALDTSVLTHAIDTFGEGDGSARILVRFTCDDPRGCDFESEREVSTWVP